MFLVVVRLTRGERDSPPAACPCARGGPCVSRVGGAAGIAYVMYNSNNYYKLLLRVLLLLLLRVDIKARLRSPHEMVQVSWPSTYPSKYGAHIFWACAGWKSKSMVESVPACRIMLRSPAGCLCKNVVTS